MPDYLNELQDRIAFLDEQYELAMPLIQEAQYEASYMHDAARSWLYEWKKDKEMRNEESK